MTATEKREALISSISALEAPATFGSWEAAAKHAAEVGPAMGTRKKGWAAACTWAVDTAAEDAAKGTELDEDYWRWATLQMAVWMGYANI